MMDFNDTFKGTNKHDSSGHVPSEFTINKTVSNLDARNDTKLFPRSTIEDKRKVDLEERMVMSQEKSENKIDILSKIKN